MTLEPTERTAPRAGARQEGSGSQVPQRPRQIVSSSDDSERKIRLERGSFRDPSGGVFYSRGRVFRYFTEQGARDFARVQDSGLLEELELQRAIVATTLLDGREAEELQGQLPDAALVVEVERIPFVSYPYEWPFEMLQAAAVQHLETMQAALARGFILKDATPYNSQFIGTSSRLIDVGSFETHQMSEPWAGYAQFCRTFLNPLLLESLVGVPYQQWLRSSLDGIDPSHLRTLMPFRHKLRPDVFIHVVLQSWLNARMRDASHDSNLSAIESGGTEASLRKLLSKLQRSVARRRRRTRGRSTWMDYEQSCHYDDEAATAKQRLVDAVLASRRPAMLWDLGCNLGQYSLIAARHAEYVVAIDSDVETVSAVYERVRREGARNVLPLYMDLANPSPDHGWAGEERKSLATRGLADFVLALALMHHLVIGSNVPVQRFVEWLAGITRGGIVEFVPLEDPMTQTLLRTRDGDPPAYDEASFRAALEGSFVIERVERLPNSGRSLYVFSAR